MRPYIDLHTHQQHLETDVISVYNCLLHEDTDIPDIPFTAGLHPWYADQLSLDDLSEALDRCLNSPNLIALGETGFDKVCKIPMQVQLDVFELHLKKAVKRRFPVILHCVRAWDELIEISTNYQTTKILHGYNGGIELTKRLLQQGFLFSVGKGILNPASKIHKSIHLIPISSIFCETDNSAISIQTIYKEASTKFQLTEEDLRNRIFENFTQLRRT
ncbi:MAG: TatD family hydrolase [Bacteroidetes bacterium]|nr:TatD family hydrolase [Bacteroidota bacterium]